MQHYNFKVTLVGNQKAFQKYVEDSVSDLQGAVKCAMAQLNDANVSGTLF